MWLVWILVCCLLCNKYYDKRYIFWSVNVLLEFEKLCYYLCVE